MSGQPDEGRGLAELLLDRGLAAPARLLLDAHRPLRPLLGEVCAALSPILRPLLGRRRDDLQQLLDSEEAYDRLISDLDDAEYR